MILVRPGDLLVSGINAAKGAIAIYSKANAGPVAATIHYGAYEINKDRVDVTYLWWYLRSGAFREILLDAVPGGIKTELKSSRLLPIEIPLPPLMEQRRIVARIEELAAQINEARALRRQAVEEAEALVRSSTSAIFGTLQINGVLSDILLDKPCNGWSAKCDNAENGVPVLTLSAVTGFHYNQTAYKRTSELTDSSAHYWLQLGDLLITRSNTPELVGHAAIYDGRPTPCIYPDLMMKLVVNQAIAETRFVWLWLQTNMTRDFISRNAKGTSPTMKKISQGTVMAIPFPSMTPLAEQRRIVTYLDGLQARVDALKRLQAETAAELDALLPSILDKAFRGEL
jgi:type I restriction enzyme S subunit